MTRKGMGFFSIETTRRDASAKTSPKEDLLIPAEWTGHALHGDVVQVEPVGIYHDPNGRMPPRSAGKVLRIVARARETFVGTLVETGGRVLLEPDYRKMYTPIEVRDRGNVPFGYKVLVRMQGWSEGANYPWGVIEQTIGKAGAHETEMRALALGQGFSSDFPPGVVAEAKQLEVSGRTLLAAEAAQANEHGVRRDFRNAPTCTIDPADAKDFDDALSVRRLSNGLIEVGVHIADVSFFVKPGNALDKEARERATSVYLVDRTIPIKVSRARATIRSTLPAERGGMRPFGS